MNTLYTKAQTTTGELPSKASSKRSKRSKARRKKKNEANEEGGAASRSAKRSASRSASRSANRSASRGASRSTSQSPGQPSAGDSRDSAPTTTGSGATSAIVVVAAAVHVLDAILGLALLAYGAIVHVPEVLATCVGCGLLLLLGAVAGVVGRRSNSRRGLWASAAAGYLAILLDAAAFVLVLTSWDAFVAFLGDHREELLMSEGGVEAVGGLKVPFAAIFAVLALLEAVRFGAMLSMAYSSPPYQSSSDKSVCRRLLGLLRPRTRRRVDDLVALDDDGPMGRSPLLWSEEEDGARAGDYLRFASEHERDLADFAERASLPAPPRDRSDY